MHLHTTPLPTRRSALVALGVHALTASGAGLGLLALAAIARERVEPALGLMALALVIDGLDGPLARWARVRNALPAIDGALLDNLVDYLNYVVVPAFLIARSELVPGPLAPIAGIAIVVSSAFQFSHVAAKTPTHDFRGFPCYWNVVAFYLLILRPPPAIAFGLLIALSLLACAPLLFVHPLRTALLPGPTRVATVLWALALALLLARYPDAPASLVLASLLYVAYYTVLSAVATLRHARRPS